MVAGRVDQTFREIETEIAPLARGHQRHGDHRRHERAGLPRAQGDVTQGSIYVRLQELDQRKKIDGKKWDQFQVMARARKVMARYPDLRSSVQIPQAISSGTVNADVEFTLVGPDLAKLSEYADKMVGELRKNPGLADVDTTLALRKPELQVEIDRDRASDLGVSVQSVAAALRTLVGGDVVSDFKDSQVGELYDVWLRAGTPDRDNRAVIETSPSPSTKPGLGLIKLSTVARLHEDRGPAQIDRYARQRQDHTRLQPRPGDRRPARLHDRRRSRLVRAGLRRPGRPGRLPARLQRPGPDAERVQRRVRRRPRPVAHLHVHDPGGAVRELRPPGDDPAGRAADDPVRPCCR